MANPKAQAAKEKGNAAFKGGDYPSAVGHYTEAILADRTDPTLPLNRAAAYLKLGKNEDAERDSTTVLKLSPSNVKAFFRRAQAREALGKLFDARQDLNDALVVDPNNTSVQGELEKVNQLIAAEKSKKAKAESVRAFVPTPSAGTSPSTSTAPKRRRVPIEIVEPPGYRQPSQLPKPTAETKATDTKSQQTSKPPVRSAAPGPVPTTAKPKVETDTMTPVSTRSLKSSPPSSIDRAKASATKPNPPITTPSTVSSAITATATTDVPPKPSPSTFSEAKITRDSSRPSRVAPSAVAGGGIFRANGQSTVYPPRTRASASAAPTQHDTQTSTRFPLNITSASGSVSPMTMFNFNKAWEASPSIEDRWRLITSISPTNIPSMCKSSLEPSLFVSIIDVCREAVGSNGEQDKETRQVVKAYLKAFEGVPRFSTILLFLSEKEKSRVREIWRLLDVDTKSLSGV